MTEDNSKKNNYRTLTRMVSKYLSGKATPAEQEFLENYYAYFKNEEDGLQELTATETQQLEQEMEDHIFGRIHNQRNRFRWLQVAAVLLLGIGIGVSLWLRLQVKKPAHVAVIKTSVYHNDINPGGNKAVLILANGQTISLNDLKVGKVITQRKTVARKSGNGQLVYQPQKSAAADSLQISYNTLQTPVGGAYQLTLPDGTKVWLNSSSSLRFPTAFQGNARVVQLTGEGYFEVAKNANMPFKVQVNQTEVQVLGTHFNIMAYSNEPFMKTTLLEGAVNITKGNNMKKLLPGQQALIGSDAHISVANANVDAAVAWKNGYFNFDHDNIQAVMRKLSRWYDMDVSFEGTPLKDEFSGKIRRNVKVSKVPGNDQSAF